MAQENRRDRTRYRDTYEDEYRRDQQDDFYGRGYEGREVETYGCGREFDQDYGSQSYRSGQYGQGYGRGYGQSYTQDRGQFGELEFEPGRSYGQGGYRMGQEGGNQVGYAGQGFGNQNHYGQGLQGGLGEGGYQQGYFGQRWPITQRPYGQGASARYQGQGNFGASYGGYGSQGGSFGGQGYGQPSGLAGQGGYGGYGYGQVSSSGMIEPGQGRFGQHRGKGPKNYSRSDDRIKEDVSDRLGDDGEIDASEIEVMVSDGEVTLSGTVDSRDQKRRAEDIAEDVSGVRNVQNNIRVSSPALSTSGQASTTTKSGKTGSRGASM